MPTITVQAADSATAMDEIWEKLGPDAMIISTSKRNGRIVMEATTESVNQPWHRLLKPDLATFSKAKCWQSLR